MSYVTNVPDISVKTAIASKQEALEVIRRIINQMNSLKNDYENESKIILEAAVRFTMFLEENALLNYQDVFENYLGQLMRE